MKNIDNDPVEWIFRLLCVAFVVAVIWGWTHPSTAQQAQPDEASCAHMAYNC